MLAGEFVAEINISWEVQPDQIVFVHNADNGFDGLINEISRRLVERLAP